MKVLILWADNKSANYGVRVLAEGMAALVRRAWGEEVDIEFQDYGPGDSNVSFGARSIVRDVFTRPGPIRSRVREFDLIVDSGAGDSFTDIYGLKRLTTMLYAQDVAYRQRIPMVMGPQTVGPFGSAFTRDAARRSLKRMSVVLTRDSESAAYATSLGRRDQIQTTDVVFALPRHAVEKARDVVLNVSGLLWFGDAHVSSARYQQTVRALVREIQESGRPLTLLAHVVNKVSTVDDKAAIDALLQGLREKPEVIVPSSLSQIRHVVGSAKVVVGARMHACLNALSMQTPAIPWAYSRKFAPLMNDIGWRYGFDLRTDDEIVKNTMLSLEDQHLSQMNTELSTVLESADRRLDVSVQAMRGLTDAPQ